MKETYSDVSAFVSEDVQEELPRQEAPITLAPEYDLYYFSGVPIPPGESGIRFILDQGVDLFERERKFGEFYETL
jgi:hypothetical protein